MARLWRSGAIMTGRRIPIGQYIAPVHAAQSYVAGAYYVFDGAGQYSANPADYWHAPDDAPLGGMLVRARHPYRTTAGHMILAARVIRSRATVGDIRRLARAASGLVG